jgi:hypothetical protein
VPDEGSGVTSIAREPVADWHFDVRDGAFYEARGPDPRAEERSGSRVLVHRVTPTKVFGYGRGEVFSATRWRF